MVICHFSLTRQEKLLATPGRNDYTFYAYDSGDFMKTGLDRLFEHIDELKGKTVEFAVTTLLLISTAIIF